MVARAVEARRWSAGPEVAGHRFVPAERVADDPGHLDQLCVGQMGRRRRPVPGAAIPVGIAQVRDGQRVRQGLNAVATHVSRGRVGAEG
jgi:hypothetical protein